MRIKFLLVLVFVILLLSVFIPKLLIQDSKVLPGGDAECATRETYLLLDNPFERILVQKLAVSGKEGKNLYVDAYTFWGIKYAKVKVVCNESAEAIWRLGSKQVINSFDGCASAGYPIMESYPRQCRTPDGRGFVEAISEAPKPSGEEFPFKQVSFEDSKKIAEDFAKNAPTYKFDGFNLKYESFLTAKCPFCWRFTFSFTSRQAGYGDRTGQVLAQVVTPHEISVTVQEGKVISALTDDKYDELNQQ